MATKGGKREGAGRKKKVVAIEYPVIAVHATYIPRETRGYTNRDELSAEICRRISLGEPLAQICRDAHMPERTVVYDWMKEDKDLAQRFARAREHGHDAIADECMQIADEATQDYKSSEKGMAFDAEHVQRSKLRIETRLKLLAKWDPKRYGEKQQVELSGKVDIASALLAARKRAGLKND
jgi:hypothetical protein